MVEYTSQIDLLFSALADPVRRNILERLLDGELTVNQVAVEYDMSLAAVSKHLKVMVSAGLVHKRKAGRYNYISANRAGVQEALQYLNRYDETLSDRTGSDNFKRDA